MTPRGQARAAGAPSFFGGGEPPGSWEDLTLADRCITRAMPGAMLPGFGYNHNYQILQTPTHVAVLIELIHDTRIPLDDRPHISDDVRQWLGDSRGHWDGDTLVVETTNSTDKTNSRIPTVFGGSKNLRLVERFTRTDENTIDFRYTFEDATECTRPWTAAIPMNKVEGPIFEYACHEGNCAMEGMLAGARASEAAEAAGRGLR